MSADGRLLSFSLVPELPFGNERKFAYQILDDLIEYAAAKTAGRRGELQER